MGRRAPTQTCCLGDPTETIPSFDLCEYGSHYIFVDLDIYAFFWEHALCYDSSSYFFLDMEWGGFHVSITQ